MYRALSPLKGLLRGWPGLSLPARCRLFILCRSWLTCTGLTCRCSTASVVLQPPLLPRSSCDISHTQLNVRLLCAGVLLAVGQGACVSWNSCHSCFISASKPCMADIFVFGVRVAQYIYIVLSCPRLFEIWLVCLPCERDVDLSFCCKSIYIWISLEAG